MHGYAPSKAEHGRPHSSGVFVVDDDRVADLHFWHIAAILLSARDWNIVFNHKHNVSQVSRHTVFCPCANEVPTCARAKSFIFFYLYYIGTLEHHII